MLLFLFLPLTKCSTLPKYFHCSLKTVINSVEEYKNWQGKLKLVKNYYIKLQLDEISDKKKSNQKQYCCYTNKQTLYKCCHQEVLRQVRNCSIIKKW